MNKVTATQNHSNFGFKGFGMSTNDKSSLSGSDLTKHRIHEKKIDEMFWTNVEAPRKRFSLPALLGSIAGVLTPLLIFGKRQNPTLRLNSLKNIYKATNIKYGVKEIIATGLGGAIGGLLGGLSDRNETRKLDKIQEATFQVMNITFPTLLVGGAIKLCENTKGLNNSATKILCAGIAMLIGAFSAIKLANKVDNKLFDKYNVEPDRKFKKKDFIVHIDDLVGTLVLAKIPLADKLHIEKLLPVIFTWSGFHVGES